MNQGFALGGSYAWLLFWGSDDWAAGPHCLAEAMAAIEATTRLPDLLVCRGRYADGATKALGRPTFFQPAGWLSLGGYRRALLLGSTPPHQATLFGAGSRRHLARYAEGFHISADLDYFLQLSRHGDIGVQCLDLELVHMADGGISGQQTQRRLHEVRYAYRRAFGPFWWFPFAMRYGRRLLSLLPRLRSKRS